MPSTLSQFLRTVTSLAAVLPALATALLLVPLLLLLEPDDVPRRRWVLLWFLLLISAAPVVAYVVNRIRPTATDGNRAMWAGLPQVVTLPAMIRLDVWLDVRSGYYVAGSSEEAMAGGFGTMAGAVGGCVLMLLVARSGQAGASRSAGAYRWRGDR